MKACQSLALRIGGEVLSSTFAGQFSYAPMFTVPPRILAMPARSNGSASDVFASPSRSSSSAGIRLFEPASIHGEHTRRRRLVSAFEGEPVFLNSGSAVITEVNVHEGG